MKRTFFPLLLTICLLFGLAQPVFAVEVAETISDESLSVETLVEETAATLAPVSTEGAAETEATSPAAQTTGTVQTYTTSAEGIAFVNEMMSGSYAGTSQLSGAESSVNAFIKKYSLSLSQQQFDALVDLVMAYGGMILTSGYRCEKVIASGKFTDVELAGAFCAWVKASSGFSEQFLARRIRELKLFLYGSYSGECEMSFRYIVFNANGGALDDNTVLCYSTEGTYGTLPTASRDGKVFAGWFTAASGGTQILETEQVTQNYRVYAHWKDPQQDSNEPTTSGDFPFVDVSKDFWYYKPISEAYSLGLFSGMSETLFVPNETTTRAMITAVLYRLAGRETSTVTAPFTDMKAGEWYVDALNWAYEKKIVSGMTDTWFGIEENVTREQLASMLYRYARAMGLDTSARADLSTFGDCADVSEYAETAMQWAVASKIVNGDGKNLNPLNSATRAECATMIVSFRNWLQTAEPGTQTPDTPDTPETPELPTLKTSEAGVQFIKDHEGFLKYAVWDYSQYSIGYGTRCEKDEFPDGITEEEADYRLRMMLVDFEAVVDKLLAKSTVQHTQAQYDAIISFTFNLGQQWMNSDYRIYKYIMYGNHTEMEFVNSMGAWINAGGEALDGLAKRRIDEANLYLNGEYALGSRKYQRVVYYTNGGNFGYKSNGTAITSDYFYYKSGEPMGPLADTPQRDGYHFVGWFDKVSGGTQYTESSLPSVAVQKLYAHWEAETTETTEATVTQETQETQETSQIPTE